VFRIGRHRISRWRFGHIVHGFIKNGAKLHNDSNVMTKSSRS
jgi:hypothetical protein